MQMPVEAEVHLSHAGDKAFSDLPKSVLKPLSKLP